MKIEGNSPIGVAPDFPPPADDEGVGVVTPDGMILHACPQMADMMGIGEPTGYAIFAKSGTVLSISDGLAAMFGVDKQEVVGRHVSDFVPTNEYDQCMSQVQQDSPTEPTPYTALTATGPVDVITTNRNETMSGQTVRVCTVWQVETKERTGTR